MNVDPFKVTAWALAFAFGIVVWAIVIVIAGAALGAL